MGRAKLSRRGLFGAALAAAAAGLVGAPRAAAEVVGKGNWVAGDDTAYVGGAADEVGTLVISADRDLNVGANHIRFGAYDGNYEFEHGRNTPTTHLNSYYIGTPTRTPISVGGDDGQDVLSFVVRGMKGQENDLQQWAPSGKPTIAVDGDGNLRIGDVVLLVEVESGRAQLVARLPSGERQVLAIGRKRTSSDGQPRTAETATKHPLS